MVSSIPLSIHFEKFMSEISYQKPTNPLWIDRTGQVYGRLTIVSFHYIKRNGKAAHSYWNCICECGNSSSVESSSLVKGQTVSCGCYNRENRLDKMGNGFAFKHGLSEHPVYQKAGNAMERCLNSNNKAFQNYGGRENSEPIEIYEPWRNDLGLMTKDILRLIGEPPTEDHQLDRDDNDRGYYPDNICWKTPEENCRNKRNTHNQAIDPVTRKPTATYRAWMKLIYKYRDEVCDAWIYDGNVDTDNGFKAFYRDMGDKPRKRSPIKRYDESKPFSKSNCYWG